MFDRDSAFSIQIKDPNSPEKGSPIIQFMNVDEDLLIFKIDGIYKLLTAETIDPEATHPETKHSYEKLYSVGTESPYVSRVIIQFEQIIKLVELNNCSNKKVISYLWDTNRFLLNCNDAAMNICKETLSKIHECDNVIEANKKFQNIPPLPKVQDLESNVRSFLNNGKLVLIETFKALNIFLGMPWTDRSSAHFTKHYEWAKKVLGKDHRITKLLEQDIEWICLISECRNAMEHPGEGQTLEIRNMCLMPGNKFTAPSWAYDLSKKLNKVSGFTDLVHDLDVMTTNMFHFFEELLLLIISENLIDNKMLALYKIDPKNVRKECPIHYAITVKSDFLKANAADRIINKCVK